MSHGDRVESVPDGFEVIGVSENAPIAVMAHKQKNCFGIQFHPEVTHTLQGAAIIERFVLDVCACDALWTPGNIIDNSVESIREQVGSDDVLLALSGGCLLYTSPSPRDS